VSVELQIPAKKLINSFTFSHFIKFLRYAKAGLDENLFVSKYKISLPSVEEMETFIKDKLAEFEEQLEHLR